VAHTVTPPFELPMATPPLASRERADARRNRERILGAAARLIARDGVDCISMDDVAAAAGVGKGTLYRRFGDRASLLRALIQEPEAAFQESLIRGAPPLGPGAPPAERLHAFGDGLLAFLEGNAALVQSAERLGGGARYAHPAYALYRTHVGLLLGRILGEGPRTDYFADSLLAVLAAEPFLYQRQARGHSPAEIAAGWHALADAIIATARSR
jgi:AcrR family transcriptional regulator